jgi:hypothetical protein
MTLPRRSLLTICISCGTFFCLAQNPAKRFHWDWRRVEKDNWESIAQSKTLSAKERAALIEAVVSQLRPSRSNLGIESEEQLREAAAKTQIKAVDLGDNGVREFLAQGSGVGPTPPRLCSPTGNCDVWVFSNGFHDLVLGQHGSATDQGLTLYQFDGSKYRHIACYDANWSFLGKDGEYHTRKDPRITPVICGIR